MDEGDWSLRDSRRIKKKGRERFHAIRIEERSGRKSIRVWCKPAGNDSCFEYTLLPPADIDTNALFGLLRRVNPVNLQIPESKELPRAFIEHVIGSAPKIVPLAPASDEEKEAEAEETQDELGFEAEAEIREAVQDLDRLDRGVDASQIAEAVSPPKESVQSKFPLRIDEPVLMSDQEVMDKALVAIGIVAPNGYAKKKEASDSIITRLGIKEFIRDVSGGTYTSVEGAMRALTMALRGSGYIERVHYTAVDGRVSDGIKGYKLTPKGLKRIQSLSGEMKPVASVALEAIEEDAETAVSDKSQEIFGSEEGDSLGEQREGGLNSEDLPRLKSLISEHEEADLQLKEIDGILGNLDSEIADIGLDVTGLELAEREKTKQMEALQGEIQRIIDKKASAAEKLTRKRRERREWEEMKSPHISEKARVEAEICAITGRNKT
jgi:hypothetical protein